VKNVARLGFEPPASRSSASEAAIEGLLVIRLLKSSVGRDDPATTYESVAGTDPAGSVIVP
jgi:hypothetical protein